MPNAAENSVNAPSITRASAKLHLRKTENLAAHSPSSMACSSIVENLKLLKITAPYSFARHRHGLYKLAWRQFDCHVSIPLSLSLLQATNMPGIEFDLNENPPKSEVDQNIDWDSIAELEADAADGLQDFILHLY